MHQLMLGLSRCFVLDGWTAICGSGVPREPWPPGFKARAAPSMGSSHIHDSLSGACVQPGPALDQALSAKGGEFSATRWWQAPVHLSTHF